MSMSFKLAKHKNESYTKRGISYSKQGTICSCKFCAVVQGPFNTPSNAICFEDTLVLYQDNIVSVFTPLLPMNSTHVLIVPNLHLPNIGYFSNVHVELLLHMKFIAKLVLRRRMYWNVGVDQVYGDQDSEDSWIESVLLKQARYLFHTNRFTSIDHVHLHAMVPLKADRLVDRIKYRPGTPWCCSFDKIYQSVANVQ